MTMTKHFYVCRQVYMLGTYTEKICTYIHVTHTVQTAMVYKMYAYMKSKNVACDP
jgi:hypothetical protein